MTPRRKLTIIVGLCVLGAALVLFASGRTWLVEVTPRPAPLSEIRNESTGGQLRPWLPALGWVALAGAGALLATRAVVRQVLGGLLVVIGLAVLPAGFGGLTDPAVTRLPPALTLLGGLAVAGAGAVTLAASRAWPALGARYERDSARVAAGAPRPGAGPASAGGLGSGAAAKPEVRSSGGDGGPAAGEGQTAGDDARQSDPEQLRPEDLWAALDQGEDPTSR